MSKTLVFRIRKRYFDDIVAGKKKVEYRRNSPYWQKRVCGMSAQEMSKLSSVVEHFSFIWETDEFDALFLCGKRKHRRKITAVERRKTPDYFSDQGKMDVDTPTCFGFHLGDVISI